MIADAHWLVSGNQSQVLQGLNDFRALDASILQILFVNEQESNLHLIIITTRVDNNFKILLLLAVKQFLVVLAIRELQLKLIVNF